MRRSARGFTRVLDRLRLRASLSTLDSLRAYLMKRAPRHGHAPPVRRRPSSKSAIPLDKKHNAHVIYPASNRRISDTMKINIMTRHDIRLVDVVLFFRDGTNFGFTTRTDPQRSYGRTLEPMTMNSQHIVGRLMPDVKKVLVKYELNGHAIEYEHFPTANDVDINIRLTGRSLGEELLRNKALEAVEKYG